MATNGHSGEFKRFPAAGENLSACTLVEVKWAIRSELDRLRYVEGLRIQKAELTRCPSISDLTTWLLASYLMMPTAERDEFLRAGKDAVERRQESETPVPFDPAGLPGQS